MSKREKLGELITDNKKNAEKLSAADIKVTSDKDKTEKKISKLILENKQNTKELGAAYKIITIQKKEIEKQAADFSAKKELAHKAELIIVNKELNLQIRKCNKAEEVMNFNKSKLELALQSSQMGTWEFNIVENKRIFDNQACFLMGIDSATFGGTAEEFFSVVHPDDLEKVKTALEKAIEQNVFYKPEYRTIWHDGSIHHISARGKILHDDKGNPQMISGIIWDITENIQKEEELKNSQAKHSSMISNISDVIGIIGLDGFVKYKSSNVEKWFGWQPQDLVGTDGFSNVHPDDLERIQQEFVTLLEKENLTTKVEFRYKCKDGSYKPVELNAINLTHDPIINGILLNYHDITEHNQAELKLRGLTSIIENSLNEIYVFDTATLKFVYVNQGAFRNLGFSGEEILALTPVDIKPEFTTDSFLLAIESLLTGKNDILNFETIHQRKNGTTYPVDIYLQLSEFEGKQVFVAIILDITKRRQAESELIKAKEKAEESDRLKSAFLTNMSHEIRTPMNGILGFTELLKEPNLSSDDQQDFIQTIQISGSRMLNTINNIVDISKIESGLNKVDIKETDINEKMVFTYKFFKPEAEIKGLQLLLKNGLPSKEAIIKTDNEKVYGILTNLIKNAIKFTFDGSIEFGYKKKGEYLEFFVKDTGIGVPQRQHQIIFERFRQGSESHNRGYEGSGLGLSIAKTYVEMLGGEIWVESEEGNGSTFYFTIPYNVVSEKQTELKDTVFAEHKEVEIKNLKILIVEDDEISYSLLTKMLQKITKEVLHAITGVEAVEACKSNPDLDLVLMDIRMPRMDGNEATRQIRQFNKDVIIIAQTAYAFADDSENAIEAGCNDYISKPINKTLLFELIKKHCNK